MGHIYKISALNIKMHPHEPESYISLLKDASKEKLSAQYYGDRHAMVGFFYPRNRNELNGPYEGQIFSFLDINADDPWLDTLSAKEADDNDIKKINIPTHLRPSMRIYHFVFFPDSHRLLFESETTNNHSLGPHSAEKLFSKLLNSPTLLKKYGQIDVIIEPTADALEKVLSLKQIKKLIVYVTRPNADDIAEAEVEIMNRLKKMKAQSHMEEYKAREGESIIVDSELRRFARVGSHNGYVETSGRNEQGEPTTESTKNHPLRARGIVGKNQLHSESFFSRAVEVLSIILGK